MSAFGYLEADYFQVYNKINAPYITSELVIADKVVTKTSAVSSSANPFNVSATNAAAGILVISGVGDGCVVNFTDTAANYFAALGLVATGDTRVIYAMWLQASTDGFVVQASGTNCNNISSQYNGQKYSRAIVLRRNGTTLDVYA